MLNLEKFLQCMLAQQWDCTLVYDTLAMKQSLTVLFKFHYEYLNALDFLPRHFVKIHTHNTTKSMIVIMEYDE